ncbi:hypothetical protein QA601_18360 [Chitinispirillales bacterium ANBcel5]|uniref:hypothetical protein n=1 Tax=Cellulosispirillum alkaliphilum TaxID=3039283 RepID=UPI002A4E81E1|nr:hypothetical protein [Chitinispirillales bacterium ANBcel5]
MKKILIFLLIIVIANSCKKPECNESGITKKREINSPVYASWSNMGTWIFLRSSEKKDAESLLYIGFDFENETMSKGGADSYLVDEFIEIVNYMYNDNVRLKTIESNGVLTLTYQNNDQIIWDYENKKRPINIVNKTDDNVNTNKR